MSPDKIEPIQTSNQYIEPSVKIPATAIERVLRGERLFTLNGQAATLEEVYRRAGRETDHYRLKHAVAVSLIEDGRYKKIISLANNFIVNGDQNQPEAVALKNDLRNRIREALIKRRNGQERKKAKSDLEGFAKDVAQGKSLPAQDFRRLVGLFGSSSAVDILYRSRPEFKGLPVDSVRNILSEYLGDFLRIKGSFNPGDLELGVRYLSDANLQEGLIEVIKDSALQFYLQAKRGGSTVSEQQIIQEYLDNIRKETDKFDDDSLKQVVVQVDEYYRSLFEDYSKPDKVIDQIKEGRSFPDVGQLINIKEAADKKRVLIADEMGLGKSASAILTKETLALGLAIVVIPGNVVSVWQDYLSDKVGEDGKHVGYFKTGQAPRVLIVEGPNSLQRPDINTFDYVLVSQGRLNDSYIQALSSLDFDMLIVDEVHKLKNLRSGVRANNLLRLTQKIEGENKYLVLLSGTPIPNKIWDVAMVLKLLYPERFKDTLNSDLVKAIINGDYIDLRRLLVPRMQMKSLTESIGMPPLTEQTLWIEELQPQEKEIYEILMEEDEIEATDKLRILRQFLINPGLLDMTPDIEGSKIKTLRSYLKGVFNQKNKAVMFVNGYIEDVIRGRLSILRGLDLPEGCEIRIIHGENRAQRQAIQTEFNNSDKKILLVVSGDTADVGVDFSAAEEVITYNEPWTKYIKRQQLGRSYREGLQHPLTSTTLIVRGSIEDGINQYIEAKYQAIEKLLRGIPITELEKELLEKSEDEADKGLEVNPELAEYYFSSWDKMKGIFRHVKEIGEDEFVKFLSQYSELYAECYNELGRRSYQSNASRVSAALIDSLVKNSGQNSNNTRILDLASGPQMLKRHMPENLQGGTYSVDINPSHFRTAKNGSFVGSILKVPFLADSFDYVNLSLALHYTKFIPSQEVFERLEALTEIYRVLKPGGKAVLNLIYTLDIKDIEKFKEIAECIGFRVVEEYSGEISSNSHYQSRVITLEKQDDFNWTLEELVELIGKDNFDGLKMKKTDRGIRDSRMTLKEFNINGSRIEVPLNGQDQKVAEEENSVISEGKALKNSFGSIRQIPKEEIISKGFVRILIDQRYVLFKRLSGGEGVIVIK